MKNTHFLQPHNRPRFPLRFSHLLILLGALLIAVLSPWWLQEHLLSLTTPVWKMRSVLAQGVVSVREQFMSRDELETENRRLREENARLMIKGVLYEELHADVKRLEGLLGRLPERESFILAHVLASPSASPYDTFIIDVGRADDIEVGDRVFFDGTIALGIIELVTDHSSRVSLFSTPEMTHEAYIGTSSARVEAIGQGGGGFLIKAPRDIVVSPSDAIIAANTRRTIAVVRSVEADESEAFQMIHAVMPVNLFETREVLVLRQ